MPDAPQYEHQEPELVSPVLQKTFYARFGAIAVDPNEGISIAAENKQSESEAVTKALEACGKGRSKNSCTIVAAYHNHCAALAWPSKPGAPIVAKVALGTAAAEELALEQCAVEGGECVVMYSGCSVAVTDRD